MDFRSFINTSLNQHVLVAAPLIPQWKLGIKQFSVPRGFGELYLLAITSSGQAAYCPLTGGAFFSIGKVVAKNKGCVILVSFRKNSVFMGGTFTILDILSYDGLNVLQMPQAQRFSFANYILSTIELPSRYSFDQATKINSTIRVDLQTHDVYGIV